MIIPSTLLIFRFDISRISKANIVILLMSLLGFTLPGNAHALESTLVLHKVNQDKSHGYSLSIGGEIVEQTGVIWQLNYTRLENVAIQDLDKTSEAWDDADFDFSLHNADLMIGYRYFPKSYNKVLNSLMFDFQLGAAVNISEHKFVFRPTFDRDDVYFANKGDVNAVGSVVIHKSFTRNTGMLMGVKYYPKYSDFGDITTLFLGFNYHFGSRRGY